MWSRIPYEMRGAIQSAPYVWNTDISYGIELFHMERSIWINLFHTLMDRKPGPATATFVIQFVTGSLSKADILGCRGWPWTS